MRNRLGSAAGHRMPPAELCIGFDAQDDDELMVEFYKGSIGFERSLYRVPRF